MDKISLSEHLWEAKQGIQRLIIKFDNENKNGWLGKIQLETALDAIVRAQEMVNAP